MPGRVAPSLRSPAWRYRSVRPAIPRWQVPDTRTYLVGETAAVAVKIRLKRLGKIREPYYRVVVADSRTKRDGRAIEEIGRYHPKLEPSLIDINSERVQYWLSVGAQPTEQVQHLLTITGDWQKFKGQPGTEGTLKTGESKADKKDRYDELVKESLASKEAKAAAKPARSAPKKAEPKKAEPKAPAAEAPAAEAPAAEVAEAPAAEAPAAEAPAAEVAEAPAAEAPAAEAPAAEAPAAEVAEAPAAEAPAAEVATDDESAEA